MQNLFILNFKMNLTLKEVTDICKKINDFIDDKKNIIIAAPILYLSLLKKNFPNLEFSSQDISQIPYESGAFTGEISGSMIKSTDINYSIIGHSERRVIFLENNQILFNKISNALNNNITPIFCIGENLNEKNSTEFSNVISNQLNILNEVKILDKQIIIAYEPVWAINANLPIDIHEITNSINQVKYLTSKVAKNFKIVYGGSVNYNNSSDILKIKNLDGVLIGRASLDFDIIKKIILC